MVTDHWAHNDILCCTLRAWSSVLIIDLPSTYNANYRNNQKGLRLCLNSFCFKFQHFIYYKAYHVFTYYQSRWSDPNKKKSKVPLELSKEFLILFRISGCILLSTIKSQSFVIVCKKRTTTMQNHSHQPIFQGMVCEIYYYWFVY